jgi:flagellar biogenesis protein FliO
MPFLQMMLALAIVLVLIKFVLPKLMGGINKKAVAKSGPGIDVEESTNFAGGQLHVVTVRGKTLLLGSSTSGLTCLADLGSTRPKADAPLFMDMVAQETEQPSHMYVDPQGQPSPAMKSALSDEEVQAALDRLNKLGG